MRLDLSNSWICYLHFFIEIVVKQNVILNILRHVELITKFETKFEVERKIHNSYVSFDIVTFAIYGKNNSNMVFGEISEFFQFPKRDICYPPYAVNLSFASSNIKVWRSSLELNLSTWLFYSTCRLFLMVFFFTWSWIEFFFMEILLVIRNFCITMSEIELVFSKSWASVQQISIFDAPIKKIVFDANFQSISLFKKDDSCPPLDTNITAWIE